MKNNLLSERLVYNGESQTPTHLHLCTYNALVMQEVSGVNFQTVANSLNREQINWLQVHGLQNTEVIREICSHFEIDFLILQDILNAEHPTKIEEHDKYTVLIMKLFRFNNKEEKSPEDELDELEYSVDVLGQPEAVDSPDQLDPKQYGVIVSCDHRRGLLLPDLDGVDTVAQQLDIALQKGGIRAEEPYQIERFKVVRHL